MRSLKEASQKVLASWLHSLSQEKLANAQQVYQYLLPATPLLDDLAQTCRYHSNSFLTEIFLPTLLAKGKLHMTNANMNQIVSFWKQNNHENPVSHILQCKVEDIGDGLHITFLPLLGHMVNLKLLVIGCSVSDELLAVLGINCPCLQVFDARDDVGDMVTDVGLAYLAQCRNLKKVFFSTFANEYDLSIDQLGFTGKGVALLLSLPEIVQVICSEYILRDALNFLYQTRYHKQSLNVRQMMMNDPEVRTSTLQILPILCPKVNVLTVYIDTGCEKTMGSSLKSLFQLEVLWITAASHCKLQDLSLTSYGPRLTYLGITTFLLKTQDIILLSRCCSQLKTLVLRMYSYGFDCTNVNNIKGTLFPSVEKLELIQNISIKLFKILNIRMKNLKELHCSRAFINNLDEAIVDVLEHDGWRNAELIVLPMSSRISCDIAQLLASRPPNLERLAVDLDTHEIKKLYIFIQSTVPSLKLVDYYPDLSPSRTGIFSDTVWLRRT